MSKKPIIISHISFGPHISNWAFFCTTKMETADSSETLVNIYQTTRHISNHQIVRSTCPCHSPSHHCAMRRCVTHWYTFCYMNKYQSLCVFGSELSPSIINTVLISGSETVHCSCESTQGLQQVSEKCIILRCTSYIRVQIQIRCYFPM
jgi:hypothetical protein